ncbi:MAG TPA: MFS transporter [Candidatus Binataceae bacterium]|nr:MFS transporter [Candidatus Binataceae bacterium]
MAACNWQILLPEQSSMGTRIVSETRPDARMPLAPPSPDHSGLFYGWVIVAATFSVLSIAYGIQFSYGVVLPAIATTTGWSRSQLSLPYSVYVFIYSALGMVSGRLTDRLGPRIVVTVGALLLGGGVMLIGAAHSLGQLYLALGVVAATGMSAAYVPCNATVVRWFTRKRGLALSITSSGTSFGMFIFPPLVTALIARWGWRGAYVILGAFGTVILAACAALIVRDPERLGLVPDGESGEDDDALENVPVPVADDHWTLEQARRTGAFWLIDVIFTLTWIVVFLPMVHIVPFAEDLGISHFRAAMTISVIGFAGFAGRLLIGAISDRFGRVATLGLCLACQALAFGGLMVTDGLGLLYACAALFGFSYGGISALFPALIGDFFGRLAVGEIVGFIFALAGSPAAFGPLIAGYVYTATGSYGAAFCLSAALNALALILLFFLKKPARSRA